LSIETDRELNDAERSVLRRILEASSIVGATQLLQQISHARVTAVWNRESPSVDIKVSETAGKAELSDGPIPGRFPVKGPSDSYIGEILVWVTDGRISGLEYAWFTDEPPTQLPDIRAIEVLP
jgi:hypothetical protein